jgi:hypothetical protein
MNNMMPLVSVAYRLAQFASLVDQSSASTDTTSVNMLTSDPAVEEDLKPLGRRAGWKWIAWDVVLGDLLQFMLLWFALWFVQRDNAA